MLPVSRHVADIIEPLCAATSTLLQETRIEPHDYVLISTEDDVFEEVDGISVTVQTKRWIIHYKSRDKDQLPSRLMRLWDEKKIPGSKPISGSYGFSAPPTDITALAVLAAFGRANIEFEDETAQFEFMGAVLRFAKQTRVSKGPAGFKKFRSVPNDAPKGHPLYEPMPGQQVAAWAARQSEAYALWMEQSTGKTYSIIMTIESWCKPKQCQLGILVVPKNVRSQWKMELERFSTKRVKVIKLVGGEIERMRLLLEAFRAKISGDYDIVYVIVSYKGMTNSITNICAYEWDFGVTDEGHNHKWHRAQRTIQCMRLRDRCKRRLTATGTPIANTLFDLYSQFEWLGRGWSGFTSFEQFRKFYGVWEPIGRGIERLHNVRNLPMLQERLARSAFLLTKKEALPDMPDKTYEVIDVEMTDQQAAVYEAVSEELYAEIEADIASAEAEGKTITVNNMLTKLLRLSQITSGFCVLDGDIDPETGEMSKEPRQIDRFDPNNKIEEVVEYVKKLDDLSKMVIWCCWIPDIKTLTARLKLEGIDCESYYGSTSDEERAAIEARWNSDPKFRVIVGNPSAGGVGLNLQGWCYNPELQDYMRCDLVGFYSQNWSSINRGQGEERPRGYILKSRSGTGKDEKWSIHCVDFLIPGTIDLEIRKRVTAKRQSAFKVQDLREIMGGLLGKREATE